jgi:hypothetical protein
MNIEPGLWARIGSFQWYSSASRIAAAAMFVLLMAVSFSGEG